MEVLEKMRDVLHKAQTGLEWYQEAHKEHYSQADDETHDEINKVLEQTNKLLTVKK